MGPRSENRGYGEAASSACGGAWDFNGSTVREPWLWAGQGIRLPGETTTYLISARVPLEPFTARCLGICAAGYCV
jgi:hypothetical protein